jgi:hypothetical protein
VLIPVALHCLRINCFNIINCLSIKRSSVNTTYLLNSYYTVHHPILTLSSYVSGKSFFPFFLPSSSYADIPLSPESPSLPPRHLSDIGKISDGGVRPTHYPCSTEGRLLPPVYHAEMECAAAVCACVQTYRPGAASWTTGAPALEGEVSSGGAVLRPPRLLIGLTPPLVSSTLTWCGI